MSNSSNEQSVESLFGDVISTYTRAQALEDGVLIDAGPMAEEVGFKYSVAITSAAWSDCVAWDEDDNQKQVYQDQSGRLWDVLYMAAHAVRVSTSISNQILYQLYQVPCNGKAVKAKSVTLKLVIGPGDQGEPVNTIMLPDED